MKQYAEAGAYFLQRNGWLPLPSLRGAWEVRDEWLVNRYDSPDGAVLLEIEKPMETAWARRTFLAAHFECFLQ